MEQHRDIIQGVSEDYPEVVSTQWEDFDDFVEKYGIVNNPENASKRLKIWRNDNIAGLMIRDGLIDVQTYIDYIGDAPIQMWNKYKEIIAEYRNVFEFPDYMSGMEYLAKELDEYRIKKGWGPKGPIIYITPSDK